MPAFKETEPAPPQPSLFARIKAALRATPAPIDPPHDRHVTAWLQQHARLNDAAMPAPAARPTGMVISSEALKACTAPSSIQRNAVAGQLEGRFPRTPPAVLPPVIPH